jgi:Holliday junction resolvase
MKESTIEKKVSEYAKSKGWLSYKFVSPSNRGVPDRIYIKGGECIFIEFKASKKKPTKLQDKIIERIRNEDILVYIIDNIDEGKNIFIK